MQVVKRRKRGEATPSSKTCAATMSSRDAGMGTAVAPRNSPAELHAAPVRGRAWPDVAKCIKTVVAMHGGQVVLAVKFHACMHLRASHMLARVA